MAQLSEAIQPVTDQSFQSDVLGSPLPVVIDFWAEWCGPCKQIAPVLNELAVDLSGKVRFASMNIEENLDTPSRYGVRAIPMLMLFRDGRLAGTKPGAAARGDIEAWINDSLAENVA